MGTHTLSGKETSFHLFTEVFLPGHDLGARNVRQGNRFSFNQQKEIKENEGSLILLHSFIPDVDLHHHSSRPVVWPKRIHCTVGGSTKAVFAALATGGVRGGLAHANDLIKSMQTFYEREMNSICEPITRHLVERRSLFCV